MAKFIFSGFGYGNETCLVRGAAWGRKQHGWCMCGCEYQNRAEHGTWLQAGCMGQ
jgi:hypothetical protein